MAVDPIHDAAERLEPRIRDAFLSAMALITDQDNIDAVVAAIMRGDIEGALSALGIGPSDTLPDLARALRAGVEAGGLALPLTMPSSRAEALLVRFDMLNPRTVQFMREYELSLIRQINEKTREGVRTSLINGLNAGENPRVIAVETKKVLGLTSKQVGAVDNFRFELEHFHEKRGAKAWGLGKQINRAPGGAQVSILDRDGFNTDGIQARRLRDFRFDPTLKKAMESGKPIPPEKIDIMVERYRSRMLKHRAQTIARTEALRAANAGALETWNQAIDAGKTTVDLVRKRWIVAHDERTCPICKPIPKRNEGVEGYGIRIDQPFQTSAGSVMTAPIHPDCRCSVIFRVLEPFMVGVSKEKFK